jgi:hypothetical protein
MVVWETMDADAVRASLLDVIIPEDTTTDLSELLETHSDVPDEASHLLALKEREILFFGKRYLRHLHRLHSYSWQIR